MARSYFSRMVQGSGEKLVPPRTVANLWKSARIQRTAAEAPPDTVSETPFQSRRPARVGGTEYGPAAPLPVEPKVEPVAAVSMPRRKGPKSKNHPPREEQLTMPVTPAIALKAMPMTAPVEIANAANVPPVDAAADAKNGGARKADPGMPEIVPSTSARNPESPKLVPAPGRSPEVRKPEPAAGSIAQTGMGKERRGPDLAAQQEPVRVTPANSERKPKAPVPAPAATVHAAPVQTAPVQAAPVQMEPVRHREPMASRPIAAREEPAAAARNGVQIGRIEVQIVSPPPPVKYVAAPAAPKGRLARGYALWPGW